MWRLKTLASQILLAVLGILLATVLIGGILDVQLTKHTFDRQYEDRALAVADVVAEIPSVRSALAAGDPNRLIAPLADRIATGSGATYVVVTDRAGLRFSHPTADLIGKRLEEPVAVLDGRDHVGIDKGSLGRSANAKAPIVDDAGRVIGQVSVGIVETRVAAAVRAQIKAIALYSTIALGVGVLVALFLGRTLKRATFGLELAEIVTLLQDREAMLHGIREGVIGFDVRGRVTLVNDEATRLLGLTGTVVGRALDDLFAPGRLREVLSGRTPGGDATVLTADALLVVNRKDVRVGGRDAGSVVTLRDRTEQESLLRELDATTGLADALRAQEHEFTNRLHIIAGLIELEDFDEARRFVAGVAQTSMTSAEDLRARIAPPGVAALLSAKVAVAHERDIVLTITDDSAIVVPDIAAQAVMTIVGNLLDNAMDAVADRPEPRVVTLELREDDGVLITVTDNGPGVPADVLEEIFVDGYSTKSARGTARRGLGLALVRRLAHRAGGSVRVTGEDGACFTVRLPAAARVDLARTGRP